MQVIRLTRTKSDELRYKGKIELFPLSALNIMLTPPVFKSRLTAIIQFEAERLTQKLPSLPDIVFYDADCCKAEDMNASNLRRYAIGIQLYGMR